MYKTQLIPRTAKGRRPQLKMIPEYITIHSTGNPRSTAQNEADNVCNNNPDMQVSFHWVVDDKQAINVIPDNEVAWHAGDGNGPGNRKSIGVEICESGDRAKTLDNAARLVAKLMEKHNIPLKRVVQHYDWSGKDCPRILRNPSYIQNYMNWEWFLVTLKEQNLTVEQAKKIVKDKADLEDKTIDYLANDYRYGEILIIKLAKAMT